MNHLRTCLHRVTLTLLGGSPFTRGKRCPPLYMQSLVPRAITVIEFGAEGDNCTVAEFKTTKMVL